MASDMCHLTWAYFWSYCLKLIYDIPICWCGVRYYLLSIHCSWCSNPFVSCSCGFNCAVQVVFKAWALTLCTFFMLQSQELLRRLYNCQIVTPTFQLGWYRLLLSWFVIFITNVRSDTSPTPSPQYDMIKLQRSEGKQRGKWWKWDRKYQPHNRTKCSYLLLFLPQLSPKK